MSPDLSILGLAASGIYAAVSLTSLAAARGARRRRPGGETTTWIVCAALFIALAGLRLFGAEPRFHEWARAGLEAHQAYAERRSVQGLIVVAILLAMVAPSALLLGTWPAGRQNTPDRTLARLCFLGRLGSLAMAALVILRTISLHNLDALLYAGPVRPNWLIDIGSSSLVGAAAFRYVATLRKIRAQSRPRRSAVR